jgi:hypothetical protein
MFLLYFLLLINVFFAPPKKEKIVIGLFTNVEVGDKVEWIPNLYGIRVEEWATWTADLNVGLVSYWKLDEASGNAADSVGANTGVPTGVTQNADGVIGKSTLRR